MSDDGERLSDLYERPEAYNVGLESILTSAPAPIPAQGGARNPLAELLRGLPRGAVVTIRVETPRGPDLGR